MMVQEAKPPVFLLVKKDQVIHVNSITQIIQKYN